MLARMPSIDCEKFKKNFQIKLSDDIHMVLFAFVVYFHLNIFL